MSLPNTYRRIIDLENNINEVSSQLSDIAYQGIASKYNVNPTESDVTTVLNQYFSDLKTKGLRYAYFDKPNEYLVSSPLTNANDVLMIGNANLKPVCNAGNKDNYYLKINKPYGHFNGKINDYTNLNAIFKQFILALRSNRDINITIWGDSISTNTTDITDTNQTSSTGYEYAPNGITFGDGYIHRFIDLLTKHYPSNRFDISDKAIAGENFNNWNADKTFSSVTKSWIEHVKGTSPDLLVIAFGMNHSNYDLAKTYAYDIKQVMDYIEANFNPIPSVVFITPPRPVYKIGDSSYGNFEPQSARQIVAESIRTYSKNRGAYICDVNRISNIKRLGTDLMNPRMKKFDITSSGYTGGATLSNGSVVLDSGHTIFNILPHVKNFSLKFDVTFANAANDSKLTFFYNKSKDGFYDNRIIITPKLGVIESFTKIADYTNWGTGTTASNISSEYTTISVRIEKRDDVIELLVGENKKIRDIAYVWNTPGYLTFLLSVGSNASFSATLSNIVYFIEDYASYTPTLTESDMWGQYGTIETKDPNGGNGVNHPSNIGLEETYVVALEEMIRDMGSCVLDYQNLGMFQDRLTLNFGTVDTNYAFVNVGSQTTYPTLDGLLKNSAGTKYTLNKNVKAYTDRALLSTGQFGIYYSGGIMQLIIKEIGSNGWTFTTYTYSS